jgi:hypothetical protein
MKLHSFYSATEGGPAWRACHRGSNRGKASRWSPTVLALIVTLAANAQTKIDLKTQAKSVDFSGAGSTKPSKTGTVLPAFCSIGEMFLKTDAPAGQNLYVCTALNVWSAQGSGIPSMTGFANMVLATDGSTLMWRALGGDVSGPSASLTVSKLQGRNVSAAGPGNGQALIWNSTSTQWEPQNLAGDASGNLGATTVVALRNRALSAAAPGNGQVLAWNSGLSQWEPQNQAGGVPSVFGRNGAVTAQSGDYSFGQISGTVTDTQVASGINAAKIGAGSVSNTVFGYLGNLTSDVQGQLNAKAAASHSHSLSGDVTGTLTTTTVAALQNHAISLTAPTNGQVLVWNSSLSQWQPQTLAGGGLSMSTPLSGDLTGTLARATVGALQSRSVSTISPTNGQVLTWNVGTNQWEPQSLPGNSNGSYSSSFIAQTSVTIPGAAHKLGTANILVGCFDTSTPNLRVQPNTVSVDPISYDVTVTFSTAQSGRCVVAAGGGGGSGGFGGGASMISQLGDFGVTWTSGTLLTVGPTCSAATPCNVRIGSRVYRFVAGTTVTVTGGTGAAYIYVDANGMLTVGHNLTASCPAPCTAISGVTSFPVNSIPLYTWTATAGSWDASGGVDQRAALSGKLIVPGAGMITLDTGASTTVSVDSAVVPMYLTATAALGFGTIATGACAADKAFALPGAAVGDAVAAGWPAAIETGLIGSMWVSAPNTITVRLCNFSGVPVIPAAGASYRGTIVRSF